MLLSVQKYKPLYWLIVDNQRAGLISTSDGGMSIVW